MSTTTATNTCTQATRFSRYRSVRKAATAVSIPENVLAVNETDQAQLNRAPSRYRRPSRPPTQTVPLPRQPDASVVPSLPPTQQSSTQPIADAPTVDTRVRTSKEPTRNPSTPTENAEQDDTDVADRSQQPSAAKPSMLERQLSRKQSTAARSPTTSSPKSYEAARQEALMILEGEYDRMQRTKETQNECDREHRTRAPNLKRRPTHVQQPRPQQPPSQPQPQPVYIDAPKLNVKMRIHRSLPDRYHDAPQSIGLKQHSSPPEKSSKPALSLDIQSQTPKRTQAFVDAPTSAPKHVDIPADAPKFDAPISAVNAGDRRVEVRLNNADRGITLPVTPTTNSKDLLNCASVVMSENFNPKTSILIESFSRLGLERPLRRYEHIRDVMNSWDMDNQNHLTIMTESEVQATGLEKDEAPVEPPCKVMLQMHLSLRPGKWDKRWVILREDGQVTMSKYENDGEATNICHLSDFDVYTPTHAQRKKLKSPKKICFAIKSQQKSAMFLEGVNFVHFFATNDKKIADQWYTAVQSWRSWYLVNVLGEGGQKPKQIKAVNGLLSIKEARPLTAQSTDSLPYQLGSFKPLLDFTNMDFGTTSAESEFKNKVNGSPKKPSIDFGKGRTSFDTATSGLVNHVSRQRGIPPSSFPTKLILEAETRGLSGLDDSEQGFTGGGLLGRSLSTRRSQGGKGTGHGMAGLRGKPPVDLAPTSDFAEGSLLRKLEAWSTTQQESQLKIDRIKRVEADVRVGEGF